MASMKDSIRPIVSSPFTNTAAAIMMPMILAKALPIPSKKALDTFSTYCLSSFVSVKDANNPQITPISIAAGIETLENAATVFVAPKIRISMGITGTTAFR